MSLADKAKRLAESTAKVAADTDTEIEQKLTALEDVSQRKDAAMQKLTAIHRDMTEGMASLEEVVKNLSNS
jgi:uncharacterized protein YigA (DUF484 family)